MVFKFFNKIIYFTKKYKKNSQWEFLDISLSSFQVNKDTLSDNKDLNTIDENDNNIKSIGGRKSLEAAARSK